MRCKLCGMETGEEKSLCPECESKLDKMNEEPAVEEGAFEQPAELPEQTLSEQEPAPVQKPKNTVKIIVAAVCILVVLLGLTAGVLYGLGVDLGGRENDIFYKDSYCVDDKELIRKADKVVATLGEHELTNSQLQAYYWLGFSEQLSENSYLFLSYGLDYTAPLDTQFLPDGSGKSWQMYFLENALNVWKVNAQLAMQAQQEGFTMDQESLDSLAQLPEKLEQMALENGYDSADAMLAKELGACCGAEDYTSYLEMMLLAQSYYSQQYTAFAPSDEDSQAYFAANEADFAQSGITQASGNVVSVRHILLQPEQIATDEEGKQIYTEAGYAVYTDESWAACQLEAEALMQQWLDNAPTETSFAELANTHSMDGGSNTNGGLYTGVTQGQMVEAFDAWIMDESRVSGDYGLVKTEFGYHLMYYVSGEPNWLVTARQALFQERLTAFMQQLNEQWTPEIRYDRIVLGTSSMVSTEE